MNRAMHVTLIVPTPIFGLHGGALISVLNPGMAAGIAGAIPVSEGGRHA